MTSSCEIFATSTCKDHLRKVENYCRDCWKKAVLKDEYMDDLTSPHSFTLDTTEDSVKPLPYTLKKKKSQSPYKVEIPNVYHKFEVEFYDVVGSCAGYIDKLLDNTLKLKYHKELTTIFVTRDKPRVMRLFRELVNLQITMVVN